ncbi:hypothetical protein J4G37_21505 [Microvirga sp. 3-52]|nr:hypothetical protein [Microvirga sp. 3-52]
MREAAVRLFHQTHRHRAGPPLAPPSINLTAQGSQALGLRVLALGQVTGAGSWTGDDRPPADVITPSYVMAGPDSAIPIGRAPHFSTSGSPAQAR